MAAVRFDIADSHGCMCRHTHTSSNKAWMLCSNAFCALQTVDTFCCQNNLKLRHLPPVPFPSSPSCSPPRILPFCPEVFVQCHGGRDQTVVHLREAGEAQASASSHGEDGCSDQHARLQRPTTPGKGQHELQHWDDSRVPMTMCSPQGKSLLSNVSGVVPETRDNGIEGITRFTINHSDMGTLTKHGQLKMAASATQVWQHSQLCYKSEEVKEIFVGGSGKTVHSNNQFQVWCLRAQHKNTRKYTSFKESSSVKRLRILLKSMDWGKKKKNALLKMAINGRYSRRKRKSSFNWRSVLPHIQIMLSSS